MNAVAPARRPLAAAERLRLMVRNMDRTREAFNLRFDLDQLIRIYAAHLASEWDFYPDQWTERQVAEAIEGKPPRWDDNEEPVYIGPWDVMREEAARIGTSVQKLIGPCRVKPLVNARRAVARRLREELGLTDRDIGRTLNRDHVTVAYYLLTEEELAARRRRQKLAWAGAAAARVRP